MPEDTSVAHDVDPFAVRYSVLAKVGFGFFAAGVLGDVLGILTVLSEKSSAGMSAFGAAIVGGAIALVATALFFIGTVVVSWRRWRGTGERRAALACLGGFLAGPLFWAIAVFAH